MAHQRVTTSHEDLTSLQFFDHSTAKRVNTDLVLVEALRTQYPNLDLVIVPKDRVNLLAYASAGFAKATPIEDTVKDPVYGPGLRWRWYIPPSKRLDPRPGAMVEDIIFGKFSYKWKDREVIMYIAKGRDGSGSYPEITNQYILTSASHKIDELIKDATLWGTQLHNEVWVFDGGYWDKSAQLFDSVKNSTWDDVILDAGMKKALITDVENFFDGQATYKNLKVPWKRGIIYYGPPGNGKTISIKAMMHSLYQRGMDGDSRLAVPTLYVRTLSSYAGPEYSIQQIFAKARKEAPCYLVFEDLDSIVNDDVRSYFLNEVDGLQSNDGILMVGSTNHLDRLDPGIAKRPSRFDRKYFFPNPNCDERVQYAKFWQKKLHDNKDLDFPDVLCSKIAEITDEFSFAYLQEAFVASLLAIAARGGEDVNDAERESERWTGLLDPMTIANQQAFIKRVDNEGREPDVEKLELWIEIQKQVKILREEMEGEVKSESSKVVVSPARSENKAQSVKFGNKIDLILPSEKRTLSSYQRPRGW